MRKIAVITGSRAEYGILCNIINYIHKASDMELQLLVTGTHLSEEFGFTIDDIRNDGFPVAAEISILQGEDSDKAIALAMGKALSGFTAAYDSLRPDIIVVLGDRYEIHAAVSAAVPFRIPVAHIHGGELTEGAIDELFRHSITKMSHMHFASTDEYAARIIQMGEDPGHVYVSGAPGLDSIKELDLLDRRGLAEDLGIPYEAKWGMVTFHPATGEKGDARSHISAILNALDAFPEMYWIFTAPNSDPEGLIILDHIRSYVERRKDSASLFLSLGQLRYLSALSEVSMMIGNSSSGIIEAPSFELPVVNIGSRQDGRTRAGNVIDVPRCETEDIVNAINKALDDTFRTSLKGIKNPYGTGGASEYIVSVLRKADLSEIIKKRFYTIKY